MEADEVEDMVDALADDLADRLREVLDEWRDRLTLVARCAAEMGAADRGRDE